MSEKKSLGVFFAVTFGLPLILAFFMAHGYRQGTELTVFPMAWMYLPACGAILASPKRDGASKPVFFYAVVLLTALCTVGMAVAASLLPQWNSLLACNYAAIAGSVLGLIALIAAGKEKRAAWGLPVRPGLGRSLLGALLFLALYTLLNLLTILPALLSGESSELEFVPYALVNVLTMPLNFLLSFLPFFGEEYGWRWFLQPRLQTKLGKRRGVLLLGLIWGLWHLPINLFFYSPETSFFSILGQIAGCVGMAVFFGWLYMKTGNIWSVVILHFLNNSLGAMLFGIEINGVVWDWQSVGLAVTAYLLVYLPWLAAKEYHNGAGRLRYVDGGIYWEDNQENAGADMFPEHQR